MRDMTRDARSQLHVLEAAPIRRIAILRALQIGDLLLAVPALRAIRDRFPRAEITLIGLPWAEDFARRFARYVDRFVAFPGYPGIAEAPYAPDRAARFFADQRAYGYDLAIQMHGNGAASNGFCVALAARLTAGYYADQQPEGLAIAASYPDSSHEIARNLDLARMLGATCLTSALEFPLQLKDTAEAARLLRPIAGLPQPWIGLHAGARAPSRRWPAERFAAVAVELARREGATIILTGGPDEVETARAVAGVMGCELLNLSGRTSLGGLAAVIRRLDLYITNDTGPSHLAEAVGTPSITLFGPADPHRWAPLDAERHPILHAEVACSPCGFTECPIDHACLRRISSARVVALAERLLGKGAAACSDA